MLAASADHGALLTSLRSAVYEQSETPWSARWQKVLDETASLTLPANIEQACRLTLMRGYAALTCNVDPDTALEISSQLERLTCSEHAYISAAAHHLLGKMLVLAAGLPNLETIDPHEVDSNIQLRLKGCRHYNAVQTTVVPGEPIQLSGRADLPAGTLYMQYEGTLPIGVEFPVTTIVPPRRLIGTVLEAVAALQMLRQRPQDAVEPLRVSMAALQEHLDDFSWNDTAFSNANISLALFASRGLASHLQQTLQWSYNEADVEYTWVSQLDTSRALEDSMDRLQIENQLDSWKRAEWEACMLAGLAMSATNDLMVKKSVQAMLEYLTTYVQTRPDKTGGAAKAKEVIAHDAIYATVITLLGTAEQKDAFATLLRM